MQWDLPTLFIKRRKPGFIIPHTLAYKNISYAADEEGILANLVLSFNAVYYTTRDPNILVCSIQDIQCTASNTWDDNLGNSPHPCIDSTYEPEAEVDLSSEDWKKVFTEFIGIKFPQELESYTDARHVKFMGVKLTPTIYRDYPNLIRMLKEINKLKAI